MATHFYNGDFFGGEFFASAPIRVIVDTHDGERKRKRDAAIREAQERRRIQLEVAFGVRPDAAIAPNSQPVATPRPDIAGIVQFDFDADDEEIILLL